MALWTRRIDFSFRGWLVLSLFLATLIVTWTIILGKQFRQAPARCRSGFISQKARCCAPGQTLEDGHCAGVPSRCPEPYELTDAGCILENQRVEIEGGNLTLGPTDWDSAEVVERVSFHVDSFSIDRNEVDYRSYGRCVAAGGCTKLPDQTEPGAPVTSISPKNAESYCRFVGGHLPSSEQWLFAAAGSSARRFPWGSHGLVCRRASFGLSDGPCASGGETPDLPGMRPTGMTKQGVFDLSGNVAEWARSSDGFVARGGSFRSKSAAELKVWAYVPTSPRDDVGFRCAYPVQAESL